MTEPADGELSVLTPAAADRCDWRRVDAASGAARAVATLPARCADVFALAWSADGRAAIASADREGADAAMFRIDVEQGTVEPLSPPRPGGSYLLAAGAFRRDGTVTALTESPVVQSGVADVLQRLVRGVFGPPRVSANGAGTATFSIVRPETMSVWLRHGRRWRRVETLDYGEASSLQQWNRLAPRTMEWLQPPLEPGATTVTDPALLAKLTVPSLRLDPTGTNPTPEADAWMRAPTTVGTALVFTRRVLGGRIPHVAMATGWVGRLDGGRVRRLDTSCVGGAVAAVHARGPWLLVETAETGEHAVVFDLRTGTAAWRGDDARVVTFWPRFDEPDLADREDVGDAEADFSWSRRAPAWTATNLQSVTW